jgi:hypothetical protein
VPLKSGVTALFLQEAHATGLWTIESSAFMPLCTRTTGRRIWMPGSCTSMIHRNTGAERPSAFDRRTMTSRGCSFICFSLKGSRAHTRS